MTTDDKIKILASAILELAGKAVYTWDYCDQQAIASGVLLDCESELNRLINDEAEAPLTYARIPCSNCESGMPPIRTDNWMKCVECGKKIEGYVFEDGKYTFPQPEPTIRKFGVISETEDGRLSITDFIVDGFGDSNSHIALIDVIIKRLQQARSEF